MGWGSAWGPGEDRRNQRDGASQALRLRITKHTMPLTVPCPFPQVSAFPLRSVGRSGCVTQVPADVAGPGAQDLLVQVGVQGFPALSPGATPGSFACSPLNFQVIPLVWLLFGELPPAFQSPSLQEPRVLGGPRAEAPLLGFLGESQLLSRPLQ